MKSTTIFDTLTALSIEDKIQVIEWLELHVGIGCGTTPQDSGEIAALQLLRAINHPKPVIFDVGANVGKYTSFVINELPASSDYFIHAFEPSKTTFASYIGTHGNNPKVLANNMGLSNTAGHATLYMDQQLSGLASLTKRQLDFYHIDHGALQETVQLSTIDSYCAAHDIPEIHLLKIDVEGHELDVLNGAHELLSAGKIHIITFEFGGTNIDTRTYFRDFFTLLTQHHFSINRMLPSGRVFPLKSYTERLEKFSASNYIAVLNRPTSR